MGSGRVGEEEPVRGQRGKELSVGSRKPQEAFREPRADCAEKQLLNVSAETCISFGGSIVA